MLPAQALVINLRRRPERLARFRRRWKNLGLTDCPLLVVEATDAVTDPPADPRWRALPAGTFGCWDSHVRALKQAVGPVLVLEDDVVFADNFAAALTDLTVPPDWEVVHLGGQHLVRPEPVVPGLVRPVRMLRTHAYLAHYPQVVAAGLRSKRTHVDYAFAQLPLRRYCVQPWLAGQDDSPGDVTRKEPNGIDFWQEARGA